MVIVQSTKISSTATYKMALTSAAHLIHKEYIFFCYKKRGINSSHNTYAGQARGGYYVSSRYIFRNLNCMVES